LSKKQKTLEQQFEEVCKAYATSEEKKYLYYEAVKEWLQQKHPDLELIDYTLTRDLKDLPKTNRFRYFNKKELLEELEAKENKKHEG